MIIIIKKKNINKNINKRKIAKVEVLVILIALKIKTDKIIFRIKITPLIIITNTIYTNKTTNKNIKINIKRKKITIQFSKNNFLKTPSMEININSIKNIKDKNQFL
jgi:hypothetical protein